MSGMRLATAVGIALLAYFVVVFLAQRWLLFPRPAPLASSVRPQDATQIWLDTKTGPVEAWHLPPLATPASPAPVIVFFHGNGELIDVVADDFQVPRSWGLAVLLVEYPGYGRSSGSPSQASIASAAVAAYDWVVAQPSLDRTRVIAYGHSLGGGAATILSAERKVAALVLQSTFTSVKSFARRFFMPEFSVLDPFESLPLVERYAGPVLVIHGEHDELVPKEHAVSLASSNPRSQLHWLRCGHNDCERPWEVIRAFLARGGVLG
jgi:pimeloyl-ACP methyl ester carboxylesterase